MSFDFAQVRQAFFDAKKVTDMVEKKKLKALAKFGAFVRRRAKSSIRKRKRTSEPGSPPSSHIGTLKNLIYFAYDAASGTTVVGPIPFGGKAVAPALLEHGGSISGGALKQNKIGSVRKPRTLNYRPRPFMVPALEAELPKFAGLFKR